MSPRRPRFFTLRYACALALSASCLLACPAPAQVAVQAPAYTEPQAPVITPGEAAALRSDTSPSAPSDSIEPATATGQPDVQLNGHSVAATPRRFQYTLSATARGVYDDNIYNSSFTKVSDYYFTIEPALFIGMGGPDSNSTLSLIYHPSLFLFADNSQRDNVQHVIQLGATHRFSHLALSFSQNVQILDGTDLNSLSDPTGHQANTDVSGRNKHQVYSSSLGGSYDLTGKLFLSGGGAFSANVYPSPLVSSQNYSGNLFINYNYSEKLTVGLGGTGGYNTTDTIGPINNDQTFEQANLRFSYTVTAKISLSASGGVEFRQSNGGTDNVSPVYELTASYQPFDGTSLSLSGSRHTQNSASLAGQDFSETTINFSLRQRFMQRFSLGLAVGYTNSDYFSTISGVSATRTDDFYYIDPSVDFNITRYWTFGAYYVHREDTSSFAFFSFKDNQVGLRTTLTF